MDNLPKDNILVWLPSPMGDAILCVPALRAIRKCFDSSKITFLGSSVVRQVLSPSRFADTWLEQSDAGILATAKMLRKNSFTRAILFKNSFGSALACFLAGIPVRVGYAREGRGILLTERLNPPRLSSGDYKPISMVDYYLAIASWLGADAQDRRIELSVEPKDTETVKVKLPQLFSRQGHLVILVPGAAAGSSKRWPAERFAKLADWLATNYNATVVLSIAPNPEEKQIAEKIVNAASHKLVNLGDTPVSLGELKALYADADLVIGNDTGPRHIAIALKRKVITLVGPNNPEWTDPGFDDEVFIEGEAPCAPCDKPICKQTSHFCMEAITVEMVCRAAVKALEAKGENKFVNNERRLDATDFFVDPAYKNGLEKLGLKSIDAVFAFQTGKNLSKENLASYRNRIEFQVESPPTTLFMKRYNHPPILVQLKNRLSAKKRVSCGLAEFDAAHNLAKMGINTPRVVAWGQQCGMFFEKRSFVIMEKVPQGKSLERRLPEFFDGSATPENLKMRRQFIRDLAAFARKFHETGYRHRDLYFCHIFRTADGQFYLIDLARAFRPTIFDARYRVKDLAQLNYSAPARYFSTSDRMRFYIAYTGRPKLTPQDKTLVKKIIRKTGRIARHDSKRAGFRAAQ
ncbi:MAG: lipopolysaccharide heptosyltransferase II [Planctomycetota bacterium]